MSFQFDLAHAQTNERRSSVLGDGGLHAVVGDPGGPCAMNRNPAQSQGEQRAEKGDLGEHGDGGPDSRSVHNSALVDTAVLGQAFTATLHRVYGVRLAP